MRYVLFVKFSDWQDRWVGTWDGAGLHKCTLHSFSDLIIVLHIVMGCVNNVHISGSFSAFSVMCT